MDIQCLATMAQVPPAKDGLIKGALHLFCTSKSAYCVEKYDSDCENRWVLFGLEATNLKQNACVANLVVGFDTRGC